MTDYLYSKFDFEYEIICKELTDEALDWCIDRLYPIMKDNMYKYLKREDVRRVDLSEWLWRARLKEGKKRNYAEYYISRLIDNTGKDLPDYKKETDYRRKKMSEKLYGIKSSVSSQSGTFDQICDALIICSDFCSRDINDLTKLSFAMGKDDQGFKNLIGRASGHDWFCLVSTVIAAHILTNIGEL